MTGSSMNNMNKQFNAHSTYCVNVKVATNAETVHI